MIAWRATFDVIPGKMSELTELFKGLEPDVTVRMFRQNVGRGPRFVWEAEYADHAAWQKAQEEFKPGKEWWAGLQACTTGWETEFLRVVE